MKSQLSSPRLLFSLFRLQRHARTVSSPLRHFTATTAPRAATNRIYPCSLRGSNEFTTLVLLSASADQPLITLWTAAYSPSCRGLAPLVQDIIENEGINEIEKGVAFAEVEVDAPYMAGVGEEYFINETPTLLAFSRQEAQLQTKVTSVDLIKDREFLKLWIQNEAKRGGAGGAGGGTAWFLKGIFGMGWK